MSLDSKPYSVASFYDAYSSFQVRSLGENSVGSSPPGRSS
jgi:hypothetical protein